MKEEGGKEEYASYDQDEPGETEPIKEDPWGPTEFLCIAGSPIPACGRRVLRLALLLTSNRVNTRISTANVKRAQK